MSPSRIGRSRGQRAHRRFRSVSTQQVATVSALLQIVVFVAERHSEQTYDLLAERVIHQAAMPLRHIRRHRTDTAHEILQLCRGEVLDQRRIVG